MWKCHRGKDVGLHVKPMHQTMCTLHSFYLVNQGQSRSHCSIPNSYFSNLLSMVTCPTAGRDVMVTLLLKKPILDDFLQSNYRRASNLWIFSKVPGKYHATAGNIIYGQVNFSKFSSWLSQWHSIEKDIVRVLSDIFDVIDLMLLDVTEECHTVDYINLL